MIDASVIATLEKKMKILETSFKAYERISQLLGVIKFDIAEVIKQQLKQSDFSFANIENTFKTQYESLKIRWETFKAECEKYNKGSKSLLAAFHKDSLTENFSFVILEKREIAKNVVTVSQQSFKNLQTMLNGLVTYLSYQQQEITKKTPVERRFKKEMSMVQKMDVLIKKFEQLTPEQIENGGSNYTSDCAKLVCVSRWSKTKYQEDIADLQKFIETCEKLSNEIPTQVTKTYELPEAEENLWAYKVEKIINTIEKNYKFHYKPVLSALSLLKFSYEAVEKYLKTQRMQESSDDIALQFFIKSEHDPRLFSKPMKTQIAQAKSNFGDDEEQKPLSITELNEIRSKAIFKDGTKLPPLPEQANSMPSLTKK